MSNEKNKKKIVKKPHDLITANIPFGIRENNIIQMLMESVNKRQSKEFFDEKATTNNSVNKLVFSYSLDDIAKEWKVSKRAVTKEVKVKIDKERRTVELDSEDDPESDGELKNILEYAALRLWNYDIYVRNDEQEFEAHRILQSMKFKKGVLTLHLTESFHAKMIDLSGKGFGKIEVGTYYSLKSHVAQRIFELATRFAGMNKVYQTTVGKFCKMIDTDLSEYSRVGSFRTVCLKRPIDQIFNLIGDSWERVSKDGYTLIKTGQAITPETIIRLDLRPKKKPDLLKNVHTELVDDYNSVLNMTLTDKSRLMSLLDRIDALTPDVLNELEITQDKIFIKNWSALMASSFK